MPKLLVEGSAPALYRNAAGRLLGPQKNSSSLASGWLHTIRVSIARSRQRRALAELNDHLLRDIGVSRDDALREAAKPYDFGFRL